MSANGGNLDRQEIRAEIEKRKRMLDHYPQGSAQAISLHLSLGKLYERAGDKASAVQEFAIVAVSYADQGHMLKAMAAAQLIVLIDPHNEGILDRLKELYFHQSTVSDDQIHEYQESIKKIEALQRDQQEEVSGDEQDEADETDISANPDEMNIDVVSSLKQMPLFEKLSLSELRGIQVHSALHHLSANEPVISGGNVKRSLFVVLQGSVKVLGKENDQRETCLATLHTGTSFGEFALFGRIDPTLSVIAESTCTVLEIPRTIILKLAKTRPFIPDILKDLYRRRILDTALARVPLFSQLSHQDRGKIVAHFKPVRAKQGTTLVREAEPGNSMYFIIAGKVDVYTSLTETEQHEPQGIEETPLLLATLKSGDFFGEQALVTNEPRSATVVAQTDVSLLRFTKTDLAAVIKEHPGIESELQIKAFQNRMRKNLMVLNQIAPGGHA
jgi:CRP-like cAMP-binding protein